MKKQGLKYKTQAILLLIYAALLFIPGIITFIRLIHGDIKTVSAAERRSLTTISDMAQSQGLSQKMERFEDLMEDQLAWRDPVTVAFNRLMVFGFQRPTEERVVFGKDGYWFLTGTANSLFARMEFARGKSISKELALKTGRVYGRLQQLLARQKITAVTIFAPTKSYAFRNKLPPEFRKIYHQINERNIEKVVHAMKKHSTNIHYPLDIVRSFPGGEVFNRRSFHWHEGGAQRVLHSLFEDEKPFLHLSLSAVPLGTPFITLSDPQFDMARILGLGKLPYTFTQFQTPFETKTVYNKDYKNLETFMINKNYLKITESSNRNGLKALLVTDSFGLAARPYLEQHFQKTAFVSTNGFRPRPGIVKKMVDIFNPDIVIFLFNENLANIPEALLNLFSLEST